MDKNPPKNHAFRNVILTLLTVVFILFIIIPISLIIFSNAKYGNVALIKIEGTITGDGADYFGTTTIASPTIVQFIKEADENSEIKVIVLEINSPGGSPVASDEIGTAIKNAKKPVIAVIREVGASGGYWIASAADYIIANRMSITGSIGVYSSYLEFSGLMDKYGVGYERINSGEFKDLGSPYRKLNEDEKALLQQKANKIHEYFISEIASNRNMSESKVRELATGEFYLGSEALQLGLIDKLGDLSTTKKYLQEKYGLKEVGYAVYEPEKGLLQLLQGVVSKAFFNVGEGLGSMFIKSQNVMLT